MAKSDAEFYKNPANVKAGRRVTPTSSAPMTGHVPVRFSESMIARVKAVAAQDGVTVSTWIRNLVQKELERRSAPWTAPGLFSQTWIVGMSTRPDLPFTGPSVRVPAELAYSMGS